MSASATDLDRLRAEEADLERRLLEVREHRARLERQSGARTADGGRPLREIVLDLVGDAKVPLNSLLIANVLRPLQDRTIPSTRFGTLSNDEAKSFDSSRAKPVYLCHCLTHDQGQAVKRFWARSDWPFQDRIIGPMSGRLLFLEGAAWTIRLAHAVHLNEQSAANPDTLNYVAADQARDAGLHVQRGVFPYDDWLDSIASLIDRHRAEDEKTRTEAAEMLAARLSERDRLFGARTPLVSLPGSKRGWVSADER
ncbi:hypothetical protein EN814_23970 [Mesorhizobium sp. M2D.F.Ca.ET.171.01.1.1]|uniref:hypothetical protein n=1 Tax=unclassified Mesorhizobium TaxID=325217 RepID=UPI001092089C|nr:MULTISPECIES: hypothetical protein [unclassified Mesorhizobium]TGS92702.1 hypothetical protein EN821_23985 [Mesorhizobium sp. M2D.F.Ca.ET.178.01.1.1]TGT08507.1 hypothetical protein EN814_23970 [Mesorhizobium sp. M2D.F.Ca.ET.171.01.1.1]